MCWFADFTLLNYESDNFQSVYQGFENNEILLSHIFEDLTKFNQYFFLLIAFFFEAERVLD